MSGVLKDGHLGVFQTGTAAIEATGRILSGNVYLLVVCVGVSVRYANPENMGFEGGEWLEKQDKTIT